MRELRTMVERMSVKQVWMSHDGREALYSDLCPFCDTDLEYGHRFQQEDGRMGGLMTCPGCQLEIAWIDCPFECTVEEIK